MSGGRCMTGGRTGIDLLISAAADALAIWQDELHGETVTDKSIFMYVIGLHMTLLWH